MENELLKNESVISSNRNLPRPSSALNNLSQSHSQPPQGDKIKVDRRQHSDDTLSDKKN